MTSTPFKSRKQIEEALVARAENDEAFRRSLLSNPRDILAKDFGITIPPSVRLNVVEESTSNLYLVLPVRAAAANSGELTDRELEAVAGGKEASEALGKEGMQKTDEVYVVGEAIVDTVRSITKPIR